MLTDKEKWSHIWSKGKQPGCVFVYVWHWLLFHRHCFVLALIVILCANSDMSFSLFTVLSLVFWVSPCSRAVGGSDGVLAQIKASWLGQRSPCPLSELWRCCYSQLVLSSGYRCLPQSALSTGIRDRVMNVVNTDTHRLFILPSYIDVMVFILK